MTSRRLEAKGEMFTLQTGKNTTVMRKSYQSYRFNDKKAFGNEKYIFSRFQLYAKAYVRVTMQRPWFYVARLLDILTICFNFYL